MNVALDAVQVGETLKYIIENNKKLVAEGKPAIAIEIFGEAGCAKSSVVRQVAEETGMDFVKINASQISIDDFVGYPIKEYQMCRQKGDDTDCHWVSENAIATYIEMGYHYANEYRMGYALPKWIQGKTTPLIMLIDDYSRAPLPVLQATNEIVDLQEYLSWSLPKGSTVVLTANPDNGDYLVSTVDSAMNSRKLRIEMKFTTDAWAHWAEGYGVDSRCINFILKNPEVVEGVGTANDANGNRLAKGNIRIWTKYFDALSGISDFTKEMGLLMNLGSGSIPAEHIQMFSLFVKQGLDRIMSPQELTSENLDKVMNHLKEVIKEGANKRQDISAIISKRLLSYALTHEKEFTKEMVEQYGHILESEFLTQDLIIVSVKKLVSLPKFSKFAVRPKLLKLLTL